MTIKAGRNLKDALTIEGPEKDVTIPLHGSVDVSDSWIDLPSVRSALAKNMIAITNFCGFIIGEGVSKITVSSTPPAAPRTGDLWIDIS